MIMPEGKACPVWILPSHPAEGWVSMNRYWGELNRCITAHDPSGFAFNCPLTPGEVCTKRAGKLKLAFQKQIVYPLIAKRLPKTGIAHVLDHSYAFLLGSVPREMKKIVTVHDLLPLREPDNLGDAAIRRFRKRVEWVKKADLILADSESTRSDLIELLAADPSRIRVLPLGVSTSPKGPAAVPPQVPEGEFIFSIGGYLKRKNLEILPRVMEIARNQRPDLKLVRAGAKLPAGLVAEFRSHCGEGALVELGNVSDQLLDSLYSNAAVTIVPSRYEGFGLPVLEAMARGCPVVAADTTSLPEVGGDVALYFHVDRADEAAAQVLRVLESDLEWKEDLQSRGTRRAREFSWDAHFEKLLTFYREVAHD